MSCSQDGMQRFLQHKSSLEPRNNPQGENGFAKEFQELKNISSRQKRDKAFSTNHGEKEYNRTKNRYKDILPYDYSRIVLPEIKGVDGSDYINGNYIKGPTKNIMYLAAQGPLPKTVDDFWRMMISHNIQVVVMACREYELGKLKCKRYWPESMEETLTFAGMKISLESEEAMGDGFTVRTLAVQAGKTKHNVTQFHYTAWPDHDVPRSATPLIELTRSFRTFVGSQDTPVLVHCSAGCGRTGTICALDYARTLLQTGRTEELSVFDIVANLRRQRVAMVQTKEQYTLVYKAVEELVNEELRKQNHLYVNVSVGDQQGGEEQNYENVAFIRSIQRLHLEEKKASRPPENRPIPTPPRETTSKTQEPKNVMELPPKTKVKPSVAPKKVNGEVKSQEVGRNTCTTLDNNGASKKPPLAQRPPQEYVNVTLKEEKTLPIPAKPAKPATAAKPVAFARAMSNQSSTVPFKPGHRKALSDPDYVILPTKLTERNDSDYVVPPIASGHVAQQTVPEGLLIDLSDEPSSRSNLSPRPVLGSYENVTVPRNVPEVAPQPKRGTATDSENPAMPTSTSLERMSPCLLEGIQIKKPQPFTPAVVQRRTSSTDVSAGKPNIPSQYSLIGAFETPPQTIPHKMEEQVTRRVSPGGDSASESTGKGSAQCDTERPVAPPRRVSDVSKKKDIVSGAPGKMAFAGSYDLVSFPGDNDRTSETAYSKTNQGFVNAVDKSRSSPNLADAIVINTSVHSNSKRPLERQNSLESDATDYGLAVVTRRKSEEMLSSRGRAPVYSSPEDDGKKGNVPFHSSPENCGKANVPIYSSAENDGPSIQKPAVLKRSTSERLITIPSKPVCEEDIPNTLYATVGLKSRDKKRAPLSPDLWDSASLAPPLPSDRRSIKTQGSSSSLKSTSSASSEDQDLPPPVPAKTAGAFLVAGEDDGYDNVESRAGTLDRFKSKAKNIAIAGAAQLSHLSVHRRSSSPVHNTGSDSPNEGLTVLQNDFGYGERPSKPGGPRPRPSHWPNFPSLDVM